ncbi:DgyrCDS12542 [Dimorphilus gyrociliatus]|uniref:ubiquitinyl hydrolase 1 n=1 Tax=Dimorphilus gyrociliatus TaxID=2664684 RepID=A0A7I8W6R7_9ANNE|nr:DgyrCDS12542 [Dimorphilus gyrociliatus]
MNSGLQCLFNNSNLTKFFLENYKYDICSPETLCGQFAHLVKKVWTGSGSLSPSEFKKVLGLSYAQFLDYRQHDCQEFLAILLDALHQQLLELLCNSRTNEINLIKTSVPIRSCSSRKCSNDDNEDLDYSSPAFKKRRETSPDIYSMASSTRNSPFVSGTSECSDAPDISPKAQDESNILDLQMLIEGETMDESDCIKPEIDLDDLCKKDTKTSNTNVDGILNIDKPKSDSEKFATADTYLTDDQTITKLDNANITKEELTTRNTNLTSCVYEKFSHLPSKQLLPDSVLDKTDNYDTCKIEEERNNTKSLRSSDSDKNARMQAKMKVNTDKNITKVNGYSAPTSTAIDISQITSTQTTPDSAIGIEEKEYQPSQSDDEEIYIPTKSEIQQAENDWNKYLLRNKSVVVDTFQGQFQSRVKCKNCGHLSVMYEPLMYLSVPLPHAMDKQVEFVFVPLTDKGSPIRLLLNLHIQDNVKKLKTALEALLNLQENIKVIVCEVFDFKISRVLDDYVLLRNLNDMYRYIYVFEVSVDNGNENFGNTSFSSPMADDSVSATVSPMSADGEESQKESFNFPSQSNTLGDQDRDSNLTNCFSSVDNEFDFLPREGRNSPVVDTSIDKTTLDVIEPRENSTVFWPENFDRMGGGGDWLSTGDTKGNTSRFPMSIDVRQCTICLEDKESDVLSAHRKCRGIVCRECYQNLERQFHKCPVCQVDLSVAKDDFVPVAELSSNPSDIQVLQVHVAVRTDHTEPFTKEYRTALCAYPNLLSVPALTTGQRIHDLIRTIYKFSDSLSYDILITNREHQSCSRCEASCFGCCIDNSSQDISLSSRDTLTVRFTDELPSFNIVEHESLSKRRKTEELTIHSCLRAFSNTEILDENNPWFCPNCDKNQCADKKISVWRFPDTLILHLKRFVFHDLSSTKLENKVIFPKDDLDLTDYQCGPVDKPMQYDLVGCVCHTGGVNAGHYTAFAKHPITNSWFEYNDERVNYKEPQDDDYYNAYLLFYQRQGSSQDFTAPMHNALHISNSFELLQQEQDSVPTNSPLTPSYQERRKEPEEDDEKTKY